MVCVDIGRLKIDQINAGIPPIYEEGLFEQPIVHMTDIVVKLIGIWKRMIL